MSLAVVFSRAAEGISAPLVTVEVHIGGGLPALSIVGLPETAVKEARDRVRSALVNAQFEFPARRITVNLAPADLPKEGGRYDLPIALGILAASGQIPMESLHHYECIGELALSGELRPVKGVLPVAIQTRREQRRLLLPVANAAEAALVSQLDVLPANHLLQICEHLCGRQLLSPVVTNTADVETDSSHHDLADVKGQYQAKRALEISASGRHNLMMIGPPGTGKTMLASRLSSIMPPMSEQEALETAAVYSISDHGFTAHRWRERNFRAPHHSASSVALVGGGSFPRPGEISLAHNGILFLDELPEFDRKVLEVLREPLESGRIHISRAARQAEFPARFQLIAAMNPCPCGYLGDSTDRCRCDADKIQRYRSRVSGPLLDRIDMHLEVPRQNLQQVNDSRPVESSATVRERVAKTQTRQISRQGQLNALLDAKQLKRVCHLEATDQAFFDQMIERLQFSMRAYHRILKVARTIADMASEENVRMPHLTEALSYRCLDRQVSL